MFYHCPPTGKIIQRTSRKCVIYAKSIIKKLLYPSIWQALSVHHLAWQRGKNSVTWHQRTISQIQLLIGELKKFRVKYAAQYFIDVKCGAAVFEPKIAELRQVHREMCQKILQAPIKRFLVDDDWCLIICRKAFFDQKLLVILQNCGLNI